MNEFQRRAAARQPRITVTKQRQSDQNEDGSVRGAEAISLAWQLTRMAWSLAGKPIANLSRQELPFRFVPKG